MSVFQMVRVFLWSLFGTQTELAAIDRVITCGQTSSSDEI